MNRKNNKRILKTFAIYLLVIFLVLLLIKGLVLSLDKSIDNQDIMLCKSAKVSGNKEYLKKCECFYKTNDIKCLRNKEKGGE